MTTLRFGLPIAALDVIDGDTLKATVTLDEYIRLHGVDAPERNKPEQRAAAEVVAGAVRKWFASQDQVTVNPIDYDKYGQRVLCVVRGSDGHDLANWLICERLAHPYDGKQKQPWTEDELEYIEARRAEFVS